MTDYEPGDLFSIRPPEQVLIAKVHWVAVKNLTRHYLPFAKRDQGRYRRNERRFVRRDKHQQLETTDADHVNS